MSKPAPDKSAVAHIEPAEVPARQMRHVERLGPRPLAFHLASALSALGGSMLALPSSLAGKIPTDTGWGAEANEFAQALSELAAEELLPAAGKEAVERLQVMLGGIEAYRQHPYVRDVDDPPAIWQQGSSRLLDYGAVPDASPGGKPVLFVPSLVNKGYVLDISARRSMLRWLAARGVRPLLVDWGTPGEDEKGYSLDDYIAGRLEDALDEVVKLAGGPAPVVGYCLGGDLALALALRRQSDVSTLVLMATPWDFYGGSGMHNKLFAAVSDSIDSVIDGFGELPVDILQTFFASLDPALGLRKFRTFSNLDPASDKAADFVALEDWLNDGIPLVQKVAHECLIRWYRDNTPFKGEWTIAGDVVDPADLKIPTLIAAPAHDRIVPLEAASPLADLIPGAMLISPPSGHIGMVVSSRAKDGLWKDLLAWLKTDF
jgi:polyhydroxyalkanoate synthase subunit PhaC